MPSTISVVLALSTASLLACSPSKSNDGLQLQLELSEIIPTVGTVTWSADFATADDAQLFYGIDGDLDQVRPLSLDGSETLLLGLKAGHDYQAQLLIDHDGETLQSEVTEFEIEAAPSSLPDVDLEVFDEDAASDGFLITPIFTSPAAPVIIDTDGDYVWWYIPDNSEEVNYSRVELSPDGQSVLAWTLNVSIGGGGGGGGGGAQTATGGDQALLEISWDGTDVVNTHIPDGHHDMVALPDGTLAYLEFDVREDDGEQFEGDQIVELAPDGTSTVIWSFWDDFDPSEGTGDSPGQTWSHANALDYVEAEDAYYVGSLGFQGIIKIDRVSGTPEWVLGGRYSDFTEPDLGTTLYEFQHQFDRVDEGILVFDNGDQDRYASQAVEYQLDESTQIAELVWSYAPDPSVFSFSLGSVQRLDSGNTYVTFSNQGLIDEVDANGELLWRLKMSLGGAVGYATWLESLYVNE